MGAVYGEPYYDPYAHAGQQISSTNEGRYVLIQEPQLVHPNHGGTPDLVRKGDPVAFWDGVGVALKTATSTAEFIPIETEGVWKLSVTNTGVNFFGSIRVGQVLFIDAAGVIFDEWSTSFAIFGYALEPIADPGQGTITEVIAVKIHWQYPYWWYTTEIEV